MNPPMHGCAAPRTIGSRASLRRVVHVVSFVAGTYRNNHDSQFHFVARVHRGVAPPRVRERALAVHVYAALATLRLMPGRADPGIPARAVNTA
jgi:hypothetical protein